MLIDFYIFFHSIFESSLLALFWILFSSSLPISSSCIWTSVFLVCPFFCVVFLCLFTIIINFFLNLLYLRSPFPRLQGWILSSSWFVPSQGWSSGLCKLHIGWDLCWVFLFVFSLMGKAEWVGNLVCWWLSLYFCFVCCLDEASCTGCYGWRMLGLVFKWFPLCDFSLFDTS